MEKLGRTGWCDSRHASRRREGACKECNKRIWLKEFERPPKIMQPLALPVEPERMNERMAAQQGCFIFPFADERAFEANLCRTFALESLGCPW